MSILAADFSQYVVQNALLELNKVGIPYSTTAHNLLMGTAAQESLLGTYLVQQSGPGVSPFMLTPSLIPMQLAKLTDQQRNFINSWSINNDATNAGELVTNLCLAAMLCRVWYWNVPYSLPPNTRSGLWRYYKQWFNTYSGAATESQWNTNWGLTGIDIPD